MSRERQIVVILGEVSDWEDTMTWVVAAVPSSREAEASRWVLRANQIVDAVWEKFNAHESIQRNRTLAFVALTRCGFEIPSDAQRAYTGRPIFRCETPRTTLPAVYGVGA